MICSLVWISWENRGTFAHLQLPFTCTQSYNSSTVHKHACLPAGCVGTFPYINVNHEAGPQLRKQLLVISNNWKIQIGSLPSRFVLKHLFNV